MSENQPSIREIHTIGPATRERIVSARLCTGLARHGIILTGLSDARAPFAFTRPEPRLSQILVGLSGWGEALLDGTWVRCEPGTAYLTPPRAPHAYRASPDGGVWRIAWVQYASYSVGGRPEAEPPPLFHEDRPRLTSANPQPLVATLRGLYEECMAESPDPGILDDWASLLHAQARRIARPDPSDERLRRLWMEISADPAFPWTVEALASRAGLSDEQLRRLCLRDTGRSPMRQVTYLRMRHAVSLLASGFYTVEAVAEAVGYENPFAFSTAFKRCLGQSPSLYITAR